jgi:hypothetical protein
VLQDTLSQIDLALSSVEDFNSAITVSLATNYTGGTVIESWNLDGPFPAGGSTDNTLQTTTSTGTVSLTAGTEYWLVAAPQNNYTQMNWNTTTASYPPGTTTKLFDSDCNCWVNEEAYGAAFDVQGTQSVVATPEPNLGVLLSIGMLGIAVIAQRARCRH